MRSRIILAIVLPVFLAAGCTKDATGQKPTPAMLSDELLTITDMPGTWNESQRQAFTQRGPENPSLDPSVWCAQASIVTKGLVENAGQSGADVEMQLSSKTELRRMMRLQAWSNDNVKAYFRDAKEAARICDGTTTTDESGAATSTEIIENRKIGDESISWSQKVTPPLKTQDQKFESVGRTTIARFGDILMVLQLGDAAPVGESALMNENDWWEIVEKAGKRLDSLDSRVHD